MIGPLCVYLQLYYSWIGIEKTIIVVTALINKTPASLEKKKNYSVLLHE